ncbi:MAG: metallophosphoesterase [Pseudomonadales bacterium]|nr:metallophosphoesterase [Pseudomonadales bacterium]
MGDSLRVLQVTDTHLFPTMDGTLLGINTFESLRAVLDQAFLQDYPDVLIGSGDIAQFAEPATYRLFLNLVREYFVGPILCVPGNHDIGATFRQELPTASIDLNGWRIAGIDTHVDDEVGGRVDASRVGELMNEIGKHPGPVLVVGHHAPIEIGTAWLDVHCVEGGEELVGVLVNDVRTRAYIFGHIHQEFDRTLGETRFLATPSTCFQFGSDPKRFSVETTSPGFRWLTLGSKGSVETKVGRADRFEMSLNLKDTKH